MLIYELATWSRILLNKVLHQWGVAWRWSASGSAEVLWKPRLALIAAFSSSVWLGLVSHIFLLTIQHRISVGFRSGQLAGPVIPWSVHPLLLVLALWEGPSAFGKGYHDFHKACQCTEAQSALKSPGRWLCWLWTLTKHRGAKIPLNCIAGDGALWFIKFRVNTAINPEILEHFVLPYIDKLYGNYDILSQKHLAPPTEPKLVVTGVLTMVLLGQLTGLTWTPQRICVVLSRGRWETSDPTTHTR